MSANNESFNRLHNLAQRRGLRLIVEEPTREGGQNNAVWTSIITIGDYTYTGKGASKKAAKNAAAALALNDMPQDQV